MMMLPLFLLALVTVALSETIESYDTTSTCESYDTKYADIDWTSNYTTANDPCFGYTTSCCADASVTNGCCYWKQTDYCLNTYGRSSCDENDGEGCPACCDSTDTAASEAECTPTMAPTLAPVTPAPVTPAPVDTPAPTVAVTTDAPTMHSAKKWERLHPNYQGGDGELLWSIYYGAYAEDVRFDAFRANQLWDAAVVRPMIQMDLKAEAANADAEGLSAHWTETTAETTSTCESYSEKYAEVDWTSNSTANDPCFGYTTSCCEDTDVTGGCCYWKQTSYCLNTGGRSGCDEDDGEDCPACCDSTAWASEDAECTPTKEPTSDPIATPAPVTPAPVTPAPVTPAPVTPAPVTPAPVTPAPVTPSPTVAVTTDAPTMHSAKKWTMLHPDYQGGDGELLWSIYYGDYAMDKRFDAFRNAQMWDADVIRPMVADDAKFQLADSSLNVPSASGHQHAFRVADYQWLLLAAAVIAIVAAYGAWYKRSRTYSKIVDAEEADALLVDYGSSRS